MCDIITAIILNKNEKAKSVINNVINNKQDNNPDGSSNYCFNIENSLFEHNRKKNISSIQIKNNVNSYDILNYHFRISTSGEISDKNYHFWKIGGWVFAHNGIARKWQDDKSKYCDSYHLFNELIIRDILKADGTIRKKKVVKILDDYGFNGRFLAIHDRTKKMYWAGDWELYNIYGNLLITSSRVYVNSNVEVCGVNFKIETKLPRVEKSKLFTFDIKKKQIVDIVKNSSVYGMYYKNNSYNLSDEWYKDY